MIKYDDGWRVLEAEKLVQRTNKIDFKLKSIFEPQIINEYIFVITNNLVNNIFL